MFSLSRARDAPIGISRERALARGLAGERGGAFVCEMRFSDGYSLLVAVEVLEDDGAPGLSHDRDKGLKGGLADVVEGLEVL